MKTKSHSQEKITRASRGKRLKKFSGSDSQDLKASPDISKEQELLNEIKFIDNHKLMDYDTKIRLSNNVKAELKGYKQGRKDAIEDEIRFLIRLRRKANIKFGLIGFIEMIDNRIKEKELQ